jgi:hypothetical protein
MVSALSIQNGILRVKGHCRIGPVRAIDLPTNGSGKIVSAPAITWRFRAAYARVFFRLLYQIDKWFYKI